MKKLLKALVDFLVEYGEHRAKTYQKHKLWY